jgi:hypothetical protein
MIMSSKIKKAKDLSLREAKQNIPNKYSKSPAPAS